MDGELSYAYAVVRPTPSLEADALQGIEGVASGTVRIVRAGGAAAAVGSVPESDFSEAALKVHLEDLDWLERVARAHHSVVELLASHTTVLPLRLATVYLDDERVREVLRRGESMFDRMLDRFADHVEWGVKVYAEVPQGSAGRDDDDTDVPDPGRAYLRRRRQQREDKGAAWSAAAEAVRRIEVEVAEVAEERARHRPQQGQLAVGAGENVANDSYLVPRTRSDEFRERVLRSVQDVSGVRVEITGPWAPYSFAVLTGPEAPEEVRRS
ncbi:GvpL/GvpF family gas vesicle protein [Streptomyces sp. NPDC048629]|uniref:GvpL/GvpF family gas vesicle protein n=1 Tax=Streptomyces sp. NPDC048629 TaxID=3154824 RepID=UPI0034308F6A